MDQAFGVYVHVPFCASRCDYCAFATWTDRDGLMAAYAEACVSELQRAVIDEDLPAATSVYVGGGTPSRLPAELLGQILEAVPVTGDAEVTVECNPEDATAARFGRWRQAGVTRVLVRRPVHGAPRPREPGPAPRHDPGGPGGALAGEAGFAFGERRPHPGGGGRDRRAMCASTLEAVLGLEPRPGHVSAYALTVEPGTALAANRRAIPTTTSWPVGYAAVDAALSAAGYRWYEVSNWAMPGQECRHNTLYWAQGDYRGIGCAAHSHRGRRRWWNIHTPERYIEAVGAGRSTTAADEVLTDEQSTFEGLALALRTSGGVPAWAVPDDPDLDGLVERRGDRAVLTVRGRLLANEVTVRLRTGSPVRP